MKKYFIFAAAAVVAMAACSKTEVNTPDQAITFQVANYVPQTKGNEVAFEGTQFNTYAWYHPLSGASQVFMNDETIKYQSNNTWAPDRTYFWPKTGTVNFYSYAGTPVPVISDADMTATYGSSNAMKTIAIDDDALLAQPAVRYGSSNWEDNVYEGIKYNTNYDVKGVPTLFHHLLAKVTFIVKFDATDITDANNKWEFVINSASLNYANTGYLTVTFTNPTGSAAAQAAWPYTTAGVNWTAGTTNTDLAATETASLGENAKQVVIGGNAATGNTIFSGITVLPQTLAATGGTGAKLSLNYTLRHFYKTGVDANNADVYDTGIVETVNLYDTGTDHIGAIALTDFSNVAVPAWNMNYKYIYTVTIKPNKTVTFDPAVVPWEDDVNTGYTYAAQ